MIKNKTTFATVLTPEGEGGIAVIGLAGYKAHEIAKSLFNSKKEIDWEKDFLAFGDITWEDEILDEVIVEKIMGSLEKVFINCHGGMAVTSRIINVLESMGVKKIKSVEYLAMVANLENRIWDFEADFLLLKHMHPEQVKFLLNQKKVWPEFLNSLTIGSNVRDLAKSAIEAGRQIKTLLNPCRLVLVGPTNAGKSTLFNSLVGSERAIVTDHPGTTRDALSELVDLGNWPVKLTDTAGLWEEAEGLDAVAAGRSLGHALEADLILFVYDSFSEEDQELSIKRLDPVKDKLIIVKNKEDLSDNENKFMPEIFSDCPCLSISAQFGTGMEKLEKTILKKIKPQERVAIDKPSSFTKRQDGLLKMICESNQAEIGNVLSDLQHVDSLEKILNWTKEYGKKENN